MRLRAIEFEQHGQKMYLGVMTAQQLYDGLASGRIKVDEYNPDNEEGYQRKHSKTRSKAFGRFVAHSENISPTTFLFAVRGNGGKLDYSDGHLDIPEGEIIWLTDGQHRGKGIQYALEELKADLSKFNIPLVILPTEDSYEEAKQFVIINKTSKGVRTDLAETFLQKAVSKHGIKKLKEDLEAGRLPRKVFRNIEWKPRANEIANRLNESSPVWKGRIRPPNMSSPSAIVSQKSFTDSLKPMLTHEELRDLPVDLQVKILDNYWTAIRDTIKGAFEDPKYFVIQKTTGVFVFNGIIPVVAKYLKNHDTGKYELTYGKFRDVLSRIDDSEYLQAESWVASRKREGLVGGKVAQMGTSGKVFSFLTDMLTTELETAMEEAEETKTRVVV